MADEFFGPPLPPGLKAASAKSFDFASESSEITSGASKRKYSDTSSSSDDEAPSVMSAPAMRHATVLGPSLPPELIAGPDEAPAMIGPVLPAHLATLANVNHVEEGGEEEEEEVSFGPMPSRRELSDGELAAREIEERAERMKRRLLGQEEEAAEPKRDTWMLDLPPELVPNFGVTARKFRTKAPVTGGDRSGWTDTPADRARREQAAMEGRPVEKKETINVVDLVQAKKDAEYASQVTEYNKSVRAKSLLELHGQGTSKEDDKSHDKKKKSKHKSSDAEKDKHKDRKKEHKKKKSKKEKEVVPERKPFDRDVDLQINRMDAAKRNSLIKSSHQLGGRFGHGSAQFL